MPDPKEYEVKGKVKTADKFTTQLQCGQYKNDYTFHSGVPNKGGTQWEMGLVISWQDQPRVERQSAWNTELDIRHAAARPVLNTSIWGR